MGHIHQETKVEFNNGFFEVRRRSKSQMTAAPMNLFVVNEEFKSLNNEQQEMFHLCVAKALYLSNKKDQTYYQVYPFLQNE